MIMNLIKPRVGKLLLNNLIGNNCPEFRNGRLDSYFFKLTLESGCLELCLWTVTTYRLVHKKQTLVVLGLLVILIFVHCYCEIYCKVYILSNKYCQILRKDL